MSPKLKILFAYLGVIVIWATTPLSIQWSGQADWFIGIALRITISALLCLPLVLFFSKHRFSFQPAALKVYFAAALGMFGGMTPMYYAAQTMPSGWISLIFGMTPIVIGLLGIFIFKNLRLSFSKLIGILISFMGLWVIFYPKIQATAQENSDFLSGQTAVPIFWIGIGMAMLAVFFHSLSTLLVKKYNHGLPNLHIVAGTAWISSLLYLIIDPSFILNWPALPTKSLIAIGYLGSFGSVLGFIGYYYLLNRMDAVRLGLITLITPVMALFLGHFLNSEPLNPTIISGAGLVILGLICYEFGARIIKKASINF